MFATRFSRASGFMPARTRLNSFTRNQDGGHTLQELNIRSREISMIRYVTITYFVSSTAG